MFKNQKSKFLVLIALLMTLLVACGGNKGGKNKSGSSDELVVGVTSFADTLEPTVFQLGCNSLRNRGKFDKI